jgi:hypothetical protein
MSTVREALQEIYAEHRVLTPQIVVEEARPSGAPLHSHFEWEDSVAGELYRLEQARGLIRSVKVLGARDEEGPKEIREWLSVERPDRPRSYEPLHEVIEDDFALQLVLQEMERDIELVKRKYGHLKEYARMMREAAS